MLKTSHQNKVKLTDLLTRMNEEKDRRNRNLALSVAAVSAVTVFGIILTSKIQLSSIFKMN